MSKKTKSKAKMIKVPVKEFISMMENFLKAKEREIYIDGYAEYQIETCTDSKGNQFERVVKTGKVYKEVPNVK